MYTLSNDQGILGNSQIILLNASVMNDIAFINILFLICCFYVKRRKQIKSVTTVGCAILNATLLHNSVILFFINFPNESQSALICNHNRKKFSSSIIGANKWRGFDFYR